MSRKEQQRRKKEAKQEAARRREQVRRAAFWAGVVLIVPLALYVFYDGLFGGAPVYPPSEVSATDHVRGAPDAALTMTIYADFQCPACLSETQIIAHAWPQIANRTRLVFRHFPLDTHRHAFLAARYAEAAARQGRFWEMHDLLYANQPGWSVLPDARQVFNGYALQLGLDMDRLQQDIASNDVRAKIIADQQGGVRAGVRGTPSLFINGRLVNNPRTGMELVQMVDEALAASGQTGR